MTWISGQKCINGLVIQAVEMKMELMSILYRNREILSPVFGLYLFDLSILAVPEETVSDYGMIPGRNIKIAKKCRIGKIPKQYL